jgi:hypothetical protein
MILKQGEKVHVITRRYFNGDLRRHFIGEVVDCTDYLAKIKAFAFVFDTSTGQYIRKSSFRERIISLVDSNNIIVLLPDSIHIEKVRYAYDSKNRLIITDKKDFQMDINEFGAKR